MTVSKTDEASTYNRIQVIQPSIRRNVSLLKRSDIYVSMNEPRTALPSASSTIEFGLKSLEPQQTYPRIPTRVWLALQRVDGQKSLRSVGNRGKKK